MLSAHQFYDSSCTFLSLAFEIAELGRMAVDPMMFTFKIQSVHFWVLGTGMQPTQDHE